MSRIIKILPGKNYIDLNTESKEGNFKLTIFLSNSECHSKSIYFYNKLQQKIQRSSIDYILWYNEISDNITISCNTNDLKNTHIIYYSDRYKEILLEYKNCKPVSNIDMSYEYIFDKPEFEKIMDSRFKTHIVKIKDLVYDVVKNKEENKNKLNNFPLVERTYDHEEINAMIEVLLSDKLTMGKNVENFEKEFANYVGSKYAIMVNSGSSANLLAMAVLSNFKYKNGLKRGDKVIIPTICWSTSVWPVVQMGLIPVFVDININTLNADIEKVEELLKNDHEIRGMVVVHILGNTTNMKKLLDLKQKHNLIFLEDTCESLGSKYNDKFLGTFGECGTYSFYFSHHITTIEGGMVVTDSFEIYELLKCLRAHGWSRGITGYSNSSLDNRFCFINVGYNLRPMETQAAMGLVQLKRLETLNNNRISNYEKIIQKIKNSSQDILTGFTKQENSNPAWFALPFIINKKYDKLKYLNYLELNNISTRPVVTGNFARQPVFKDLNLNINPEDFGNAEIVHKQGFFIGLPSYKMTDEKIDNLVHVLLGADYLERFYKNITI